jgi:hypothetical protein
MTYSLPGDTVERGIADRLQVRPEAFLVLPQHLIAHLSPDVAGETCPDEK